MTPIAADFTPLYLLGSCEGNPRLLTSVTLSDGPLSTGAEGMPMVDAIITSLAFSGESSSLRPCGTEPGEGCSVTE